MYRLKDQMECDATLRSLEKRLLNEIIEATIALIQRSDIAVKFYLPTTRLNRHPSPSRPSNKIRRRHSSRKYNTFPFPVAMFPIIIRYRVFDRSSKCISLLMEISPVVYCRKCQAPQGEGRVSCRRGGSVVGSLNQYLLIYNSDVWTRAGVSIGRDRSAPLKSGVWPELAILL